jgi:FkbM family methyltransferase
VVLAGNQFTARFKDALRPWASALPQFSGLPSWSRTMGVLKHHGFSPVTVFDIGVGYGTFPLYRAFPDAFYHLIDPAHESLAHMKRLARRLRCEVHPVALGDHEGTAMLEVRADIQESTLLEEVGPRRVRRHDRVPLRRFDMLFGPIMRPSLCKIDVQGAEQMVLAGMTGRLGEIDALVIETSTIATVQGGAEIGAIVRFLAEHDFALTDIVGLRRRPLDGATAQLDLLFVPNKAPPRSDRRWAASA